MKCYIIYIFIVNEICYSMMYNNICSGCVLYFDCCLVVFFPCCGLLVVVVVGVVGVNIDPLMMLGLKI